MPMDIILLFPSEQKTKTVEDVVSFETDHGDKNTIILDQTDGRAEEHTARGLTVAAGTESGE